LVRAKKERLAVCWAGLYSKQGEGSQWGDLVETEISEKCDELTEDQEI